MAEAMSSGQLKSLLAQYDKSTRFDTAVIDRALDDSADGTAFREWIQTNLGSENLLTKDELDLYLSLDDAGQVDQLVESRDMASVQTISEDELKTAIAELDRSTAAVSKQTETLKQHQKALSKLVHSESKAVEARAALGTKRDAQQDAERKSLISSVETMSQALDYAATDIEEQVTASGGNLKQAVEALLKSDDKLLSSLQKLGWELDPEDPEEKENIEKFRGVCMKLIKYSVETVRTKLDRLYLEALASAQRHDSLEGSDVSEDVGALQEEVESLYSEVFSVAQMSVEQQYLEPALKGLSAKNGQSMQRSASAVTYINSCLDYLLERIALVLDSADTMQSHQLAAASLIESARKELAAPVERPQRRQLAGRDANASPARPRSQTTSSAVTPAPKRHAGHGRRNSSDFRDEQPIDALFRLLAVSVPTGPESGAYDASGDISATIAALAECEASRSAKASDVSRNAQESFEKVAGAHLVDARRAIQLLRDSVLAESYFGEEVKLVDPEFESSVVELGQEVARVRERVEGAEAARAGRAAKGKQKGQSVVSEKQAEMLERWGS